MVGDRETALCGGSRGGIPPVVLGSRSPPRKRRQTREATVQQSQPGAPLEPRQGRDLLAGKVVVLTAAAGTGVGGAAARRRPGEGPSLGLGGAHAARVRGTPPPPSAPRRAS